MTDIDLSRAEWYKSGYSGQSGNCVEVARNLSGLAAIRDSKAPGGHQAADLAGDLAGLYQARARLAAHHRWPGFRRACATLAGTNPGLGRSRDRGPNGAGARLP